MAPENDAVGGGGGREAELKRKKRDFDIMTSNVIIEYQKHLLAALHFQAVYDRLFFLPSILLTLLSGSLAMVAQSDLYSDAAHIRSVLGLSISILSAVSVFWQSWMKQQDLGGRARLHDSAAVALAKICKSANIRSIDAKDGLRNMGRDPTSSDQHQGGQADSERSEGGASTGPRAKDGEKNEFDTLSKQFDQALEGCTSVVPVNITAAFNALHTRINVCNRNLFSSADDTARPKIAWERVYPALYYQMTLTITGSRLWPYIVPEAEWAVEKTIEDFKKLDANVVEFIVTRAQEIDKNYGVITVERATDAADGGGDAKMGSSAFEGGAGLEEPLLSSGETV